MGAPVTVKNAVDVWTDQSSDKGKPQAARLHLRSGAPNQRFGWIYFNKPWPEDAYIIDAKLQIWNGDNWTTSRTLTATLVTQKWLVNRIKHSNMPTVSGSLFTAVTKATASPDTMWEFDVTDEVQNAANSGDWFGFRISTNSTTAGWVHSSESPQGKYRPRLVVTWMEYPDEPDSPNPSGALAVSRQRTVVTYDFNDPMGDFSLVAQQIQFGASQALLDAGTATWDSGEISTSAPEYDTSVGVARSVTVTTNSTTTITFASGLITSADIGATIVRTGIPAGATITAVPTATSATISAAATTSATSAATVTRLWAGLADGAGTWWRARAKDSVSGVWSPWMLSTFFVRSTKGTLTFTALTAINEGSPTITWGLSGRTQRAYQLAIAYADSPNDWIWDSGIVTSTANNHTIPWGVIKDASVNYIVTLRVWDTIDRVATIGDPEYVEIQSASLPVAYDGAVTNIAALAMASDPLLPLAVLTFTRTSSPDFFQVMRSDDNVNWTYVMEVVGTEALVSGTNYSITDAGAQSYATNYWKVVPVVAGKQGTGQVVSGSVRRLAPFIYRTDGTDACCFLNPQRRREFDDVQEMHSPLSGDTVLVTQRLGKRGGSVAGRFTPDSLGITAEAMLKRFLRLRRDSGMPMMVATANETLLAVCYNFQYDILTDASGITYAASFDYREI